MILKFLRAIARAFFSHLARRQCGGFLTAPVANGFTKLTSHTYLGRNTNFNGMHISGQGTVRIGDNFHSGKACVIMTQIHNYDKGDAVPYDDTYIVKNTFVGANVWLGDRVTLLAGVTIGEGAIIQACSVVVADVPECAIAGGHPARVFKYRDVVHYNELKQKGAFC